MHCFVNDLRPGLRLPMHITMKLCAAHHEIRAYLELTQQLYACAFRENDREGMIETSHDLSLAYHALEHATLAEKWADEYLCHALEQPSLAASD